MSILHQHVGVSQEQLSLQLMELGARLDQMFNGNDPLRGTSFTLLVCYDGATSVLSNMDQQDLKVALKLQLARLEGQPFHCGNA